ncbi:MAG: alpha-galactosidase, partial [Clostridia bacterium]|nr:alpha-galactosidase [Clostridia bacterium]
VAMYHKYNDLIRRGDYYRIASWRENHRYDCWAVVAKDQREALVTFVQVLGGANEHSWRIRCKGLDPLCRYRVEGTDQIMSGAALMYAGLQIKGLRGDFIGRLIHLLAEPEV